jgi:hypothetical protein
MIVLARGAVSYERDTPVKLNPTASIPKQHRHQLGKQSHISYAAKGVTFFGMVTLIGADFGDW